MKPLLATKLRNALRKSGGDYTFYLHDITVNYEKRGCSGFIKNNLNGTFVYVNTERPVLASLKNYMFRYADHEKDYRGYRNRWADSLEELVEEVSKLLLSDPVTARDIRI